MHACKIMCVHNVGTKGVARAMNKICQGPAYKEGTTWFRQLSDKRMLVKITTTFIEFFYYRKEYKDTSLLGDENM